MRYIIKRKRKNLKSNWLLRLLKYEKQKKIGSFEGCIKFKKKVEKSKIKLNRKIKNILSKGNKICGYGATSKSTTILNYCGINNKMIDCIFDTTKDKIGKLSPGSHIPIEDYKKFNGELGVKEAGKLKQEGKGYIVKDGDIFHFLFNV